MRKILRVVVLAFFPAVLLVPAEGQQPLSVNAKVVVIRAAHMLDVARLVRHFSRCPLRGLNVPFLARREIPALDHEIFDDAVKDYVVEEVMSS